VLSARGLHVGYGAISVVQDLDFEVSAGEIVAILGPNGAGKTTTLSALAGELYPSSGEVLWRGVPIRLPLHHRANLGLRMITEDRAVFMKLTVADNLKLGRAPMGRYLELFPELEPLLKRKAGLLSGGEQQILAVCRAIGDEPDVLLADELSLGLAPQVVLRLLRALRAAADRGMAVVLVEQHVETALEFANRGYVLRRGTLVMQGGARELAGRLVEIEESYLASAVASTMSNGSDSNADSLEGRD
jgi:branched-chain amino acid transport system ATP-binding protein